MVKIKKSSSEVKQIGRFGLVGILNTLVDFLVLNILVVTILPASRIIGSVTIAGVDYTINGILLAGVISGTLAMINSFVFNMRFTFKKKHVDTKHGVYFFVITIFGLFVIRPIILKIFTDIWLWPAQITYQITQLLRLPLSLEFDTRNLALLLAILAVLGYNYLMYKYFVFNNVEK